MKTIANTVEEDVINISILGDIDVTLDRKKLAAVDPGAISVQIPMNTKKKYGPFAELANGLSDVVKSWDTQEIIEEMCFYWNRVKILVEEMTRLQQRYSSDFVPVPERKGISCSSTIFVPGVTKFKLIFEITPETIQQYPRMPDYEYKHYYGRAE